MKWKTVLFSRKCLQDYTHYPKDLCTNKQLTLVSTVFHKRIGRRVWINIGSLTTQYFILFRLIRLRKVLKISSIISAYFVKKWSS